MLPLEWQKGRQPRRLLCFSAAFFMIALVFSLLFSGEKDLEHIVLLTAACACGLGALGIFLLRERFPLFLSVFIGLLAGVLWCGGFTWLIWQPTQQYDGMVGNIRLELTEYAESKESYGVAYGLVTQLDGQDCRLKVKAYLIDGSPEYAPGDVLLFEGRLEAAQRGRNQNLLQEGIYLTLSQDTDEVVLPAEAMTPLRHVRILSRKITLKIQEWMPGDEGALLAALLSGERDGFSNEFDRALTASGTRHITAVSGLHVTILAGILMSLFGKKTGLLVSVPAAVVYAAIVGFSPSVVRATVLLIFWAISFWCKLEKDSLTSFAAALLLLLLYRPFSCLSAGLLLSFAATLGLILLSAPLNQLLTKRIKTIRVKPVKKTLWYLSGTITATLAATLFTLPLNILFFDSIPLLGLLSNLLILWVLSFTMTLGIVTLVVSLLSPWAAEVIATHILIWPLRWMVTVINWIGGSRFAAIDSGSSMLLTICLAFIVIALLWKGQFLSGKVVLSVAMVLICAAGVFTAGERMLTGVVEIESIGGQPVILLRNEGVSLINTGARPKMAAETVQTALSRWNAVGLETILCTTGDYKTQGGLWAVTDVAEAERILLPSSSAEVLTTLADQAVTTYSRSGSVTVSGSTVQLLSTGEDTFALRLLCDRFSLFSLCGIKETAVPEVLQNHECAADILLIDDSIANQWELLYEICRQVSPSQIVITTTGYSEHSDSFCSIPVTLLQQETLQFRFLR